MKEFDYLRPETISELKRDLSSPGARILAGGTDIVPKMRDGQFSAEVLVDPSRVDSLRFIEDHGNKIILGSLTTHQELAESTVLRNINPALAQAAETIGCVQTRNRGTLGGNILFFTQFILTRIPSNPSFSTSITFPSFISTN